MTIIYQVDCCMTATLELYALWLYPLTDANIIFGEEVHTHKFTISQFTSTLNKLQDFQEFTYYSSLRDYYLRILQSMCVQTFLSII